MADTKTSNIDTDVSQLMLGLNLDNILSQVKPGNWTYSLNAVCESFDGQSLTIQNEEGNVLCTNFPTSYKVIGAHNIIEKSIIVFFLTNGTNSQIGVLDTNTCLFTPKITFSCYLFSINRPILQAVHKITNCSTEVYFTDGGPRMYIDLDNLPYTEVQAEGNCIPSTTADVDCNKMLVQPHFSIPQIDIDGIENDGQLTAGTMQFAIQYSNALSEAYTSFYSITNPVSIFDPNKVTQDFNYEVNKSVNIHISNIDTTGYYDYYNLAVIKTVNNIPTPYLVGTYKITGDTQDISYTGQDKTEIALSIFDIEEKYPIYKNADGVTAAQDTLIWYGLETEEQINYQKIWNKVHLQWETYKLLGDKPYANQRNVVSRKGYFRDETYALEGCFLLANGKQTDGFHIHGRASTPNDLEYIFNDDVPSTSEDPCVVPVPLPKWKVYNTATSLGKYDVGTLDCYYEGHQLICPDNPCYEGKYEYGDFAYVESTDRYPCRPDIWGELADQPIRHHKFPDSTITHIHDDQGYIYPIGIKLNIQELIEAIRNSDLTEEQKSQIVGFKILRGNRANNKSIVGRGLLTNVGEYERDNSKYLFPNYGFNDVRPSDPFLFDVSYPYNNRFTFHSPDTSFYQPTLGNILKLETAEYGIAKGHFVQVKNHAKYQLYNQALYNYGYEVGIVVAVLGIKIGVGSSGLDWAGGAVAMQMVIDILQKVCPKINYTYQSNSLGNYDSYAVVPNMGNKQRNSDIQTYAIPGMLAVGDVHPLNNFQRESSIYLRTTKDLPLPSSIAGVPQDTSKWTLDCDPSDTIRYNPISSYYSTIKRLFNNQYGLMYSYETIDTGFQFLLDITKNLADPYTSIFGGDCFINRFAYKSKIPFFLDNRVGAPDNSDIFFNEIGNVGRPRYWFSTDIDLHSFIGAIFSPTPQTALNCDRAGAINRVGKMYLFDYAIPNFYCESEVNVDLRQAFNGTNGDFFPHVGTDIPDEWLQEINTSIQYDNTYFYNKTYSKQNKENTFTHLPEDWTEADCKTQLPFRGIFSEKQEDITNYRRNNWLIYRPAAKFDFPQNNGMLTSLDGIENRQVLARFENKTLLYNALLTAPTSAASVYLGSSLFSQQVPPLDFADTDLGYAGSQHKFLLKTEYGHITADAKRGQVFILEGQRAKELTNENVSKFFTEFLQFEIKKAFPQVNIDNNFNGCGLHGVYDPKYDRFIITKIDYKPIVDGITYNDGKYYISKDVTITYPDVCCPSDYNEQDGRCVKITTTPANKNTEETFIATPVTDPSYAVGGTRIYNPGFSSVGNGTYTQISISNTFWTNTLGTNGPINRIGFWNNTVDYSPVNIFVYVTVPIVVPEDKEYFIGITGDDIFALTIDCVDYIVSDGTVTFNTWNIYPITLTAGTHFIKLKVKNTVLDTPAMFAAEVYDNTSAEIQAATSYDDLNLIFTSSSLFGQAVEGFNYSCSGDCGNVVYQDGSYVCINKYELPINCRPVPPVTEKVLEEIQLGDTNYFCNNSFTMSYSFKTQSWTSFHSYIPNYYVGNSNFFYSGRNDIESIWRHCTAINLFNTFYGELAQYIIEYLLSYKGNDEILQNIQDYSKILKYTDYREFIETDDYYFSHAIIYNNQQCSGTLKLTKKPANNLQNYSKYPIYYDTEKEILFTKSNSFYNFNTFWSLNKSSQQPMFIKSCESLSIYKEINNSNMNYSKRAFNKAPLMAKDCRIRLINKEHDDLKFVSQFLLTQSQISYK